MHASKLFCIALLSIFFLTSCERDDICPENAPRTPQLVIQFFDIDNPQILKNVQDLVVQSPDRDFLDFGTTSEIKIPLKSGENITKYNFIRNAESDNNANSDQLIFDYSRENEFINRACGFRVVYLDLQSTLVEEPDEWIKSSLVQQSNINNENETHLYIYH